MVKNLGKPNAKMQALINAWKRYGLSHAEVQMARELGMNPNKLGKLHNHHQEPWKMPLRQFIRHLYFKRFAKEYPDIIQTIEEKVHRDGEKKAIRREAKLLRRQNEAERIGQQCACLGRKHYRPQRFVATLKSGKPCQRTREIRSCGVEEGIAAVEKIGRNDPCPCGSGKKYKRCCLTSPAKDGLAAGFTVEDRHSALAKLKRFVERELGQEDAQARESFYGRWQDRLGELTAMDPYWPDLSESVYAMWFYFDFELPTGGRVADLFLERNWQLSLGERYFIQALRRTAMRLYDIEDLSPGISVTLKDVLAETQVTVQERLGSRSMSKHSLIAARVNGRGASGLPEIEAGLLHIPELVRERVVSQLSAHREDYRREHADSSDTEFFKEMAPFFHEAWMSCLLDPPVPRLMNADAEDVLITRIRFDVTDADRLKTALDSAKELEREGESAWRWLGTNSNGQPAVLGSIVIEGESLELHCMSAQRGERGRALIEKLAAGMVRHRFTTHENVTMKVRDELRTSGEPKKQGVKTQEGLPREVQEALVLDHMARHYRQWLDEPVPALDGHTPRDAAGDAELRPKLIGLIGQLEGMYHRALKMGEPAYDPAWMWDELRLRSRASPDHPPPLAHERMASMTPGIAGLCQTVAEHIRGRPGFDHKSTILTAEETRTNLEIQRFLRDHEQQSERALPPSAVPQSLAMHVRFMTNFDLHRRKIFWVDESLAYMLAKTDLDVPGGDVRAPFPCFALVFTDRHTLSLAERLCAMDQQCTLAGHFLRVVTVYIIEERIGENRILTAGLALDALGPDPPPLIVNEIPLAEHTQIARFLEGLAPLPMTDPPVLDSHPLRGLLHIILNAILYATSAGVEPELRRKPDELDKSLPPETAPLVFSSENVFFLPGKTEISRVRNFQKLERVSSGRRILHRFMVRGHWRRAAANWTDQRMRWIEPYWKGPDIAAVVEREYRLKP